MRVRIPRVPLPCEPHDGARRLGPWRNWERTRLLPGWRGFDSPRAHLHLFLTASGSSSGRTPSSDLGNAGSIPAPETDSAPTRGLCSLTIGVFHGERASRSPRVQRSVRIASPRARVARAFPRCARRGLRTRSLERGRMARRPAVNRSHGGSIPPAPATRSARPCSSVAEHPFRKREVPIRLRTGAPYRGRISMGESLVRTQRMPVRTRPTPPCPRRLAARTPAFHAGDRGCKSRRGCNEVSVRSAPASLEGPEWATRPRALSRTQDARTWCLSG